ncbi:MAG: ArsA family ATPase [Candidatus Aenigmatarchaeota archaeon]
MDLSFTKKRQKYIFFSGKGGVGKTTLSAAKALELSKQDKKVLIVSTDPAHSLSDSFDVKIDPEITEITNNLYGVEIDPKKAMDDYQKKMKSSEMEGMDILGGFGLDELNMAGNSPGMNEFAAFNKFLEFMDKEEFDYVVFDTAPTGHTLKFLSLPDIMGSWIGKMIKIKSKFSQMTSMFKGFMPFGEKEDEEQFDLSPLEELEAKIREAKDIMSDEEKTDFNLVTIPEKMSILETERTVEELHKNCISVNEIIINKIIPEQEKCEFCKSRRKMQLDNLKDIKIKFQEQSVAQIPLLKDEIVGINRLEELNRGKGKIKEKIEEVQPRAK